MVFGIFLKFCLDLELFAKIKKTCYTLTKIIFANKLRPKQNKKNHGYPFAGIAKWETCAKFQQKIFKPYGG